MSSPAASTPTTTAAAAAAAPTTTPPAQRRLLIVANRLPLTVTETGADDQVDYSPSTGGLATGLASLKTRYEKHWIGWPGIHPRNDQARRNIIQKLESDNIHPIFLSESAMELYYKGFSNKVIWPLFHYFSSQAEYDPAYWEEYQKVNQQFCDEVLKHVRSSNDIIWIHDYHLLLLPQMLRAHLPDAQIGFFLHIPFPSFEVYRTLPWRAQILEGLLGSDLIGLHTSEYMRHFMSSVYRVLGYEHNLSTIDLGTRSFVVHVDTHPMGIDYDKFSKSSQDPKVQECIETFRQEFKDTKLILSVDRLDYTKGILQRIKAFDQLLSKRSDDWTGRITLVIILVPSRDDIDDYAELKDDIDQMVGHINGKYAKLNWTPVQYYYRSLPFEQLAAMYNVADIALLTPFRDGMNLTAKEYVACKTERQTGVLILSEMAGTAIELPQALLINPNYIDEIVGAIERALVMPEHEQKQRLTKMKRRLQRQTVQHWANQFMYQLANIHDEQLKRKGKEFTRENCQQLVHDFRTSQRRLILLDYDGTLVPFFDRPEKAVPDQPLVDLLNGLMALDDTSVVIISGRNHIELDEWFGPMDKVGLIGEHGGWLREAGQGWRQTIEPELEWKEELYPILEEFTDKTPGSFVEEKPYSVAWHYRNVDAWIADLRSQELIKSLIGICTKNNLHILSGHKVVEIKMSGLDKGTATKDHWLGENAYDFVLAFGDDLTDEDMFRVLPGHAYSIRIGYEQTAARFNVGSNVHVRDILRQIVDSSSSTSTSTDTNNK